ncbi:hypothetical protein [Mycetocola zhujimingii]|uniref:hypothetical protein n=1 Tax=Mycetocola zhujimingii TaxID=2079792 RepID=UPI001E5EDB24|nr:hypothetical protein [Mycetocola zhujimingii]
MTTASSTQGTPRAPQAAGSPSSPVTAGNPQPLKRIWNAARLNLINKWTVYWIPLMILTFIWLINMLIWWIIAANTTGSDRQDALDGTQWSGASFYIFVYMLVIGVGAMNMTFAYALGLSLTRREFYLGSTLAFLLLSVSYGVILTLLSYVEEWTNGWGFGGHMFTSVYFGTGEVWQRLFIFTVAMMFFAFIGTVSGAIFMRWRTNGLLVASAISIILIVGAVALFTLTQTWHLVGEWFVASGPQGVVAWLLVPTVLSALAGYFILSRATPRG